MMINPGYQAMADEILIYDEIGFFGVGAKQFRDDLGAIESDSPVVRINSPGGDVFEGLAMHNTIRQDPRDITVVIDGLAASAASIVAMGGSRIEMAKNAFVMIHNAWAGAVGNAKDLREVADVLGKIDGQLAAIYASRGTGSTEDFAALMDAETWFTTDEALEAGLVDTAAGSSDVKALVDLTCFNNVPAAVKRRVENDLRDAGYSAKAAKAAIANGLSILGRDGPKPDDRDDLRVLMTTLKSHGY